MAIFQLIKIIENEENYSIYLQRGLAIKPEYVSYFNSKNVYTFKVDLFNFKKEISEVTLVTSNPIIIPGRRIIINAMSGNYV